jgi:hypothetical protein
MSIITQSDQNMHDKDGRENTSITLNMQTFYLHFSAQIM